MVFSPTTCCAWEEVKSEDRGACAQERAWRNRMLATVHEANDTKRLAILNTAPYTHPCNW